MYISIDNNQVIIEKGGDYELLSNGHKLNNCVYHSSLDLTVVEVEEVPSNVIPQKYCYSEVEGFYPNPNYTSSTNEEIDSLKAQITLIQAALDDVILNSGGAL